MAVTHDSYTLRQWQRGKLFGIFEMILERSLTYGLCEAGFVSGFYHVYLSSWWSGYSAFHSTSNPSTPNHFTQCRNVRLSQYNNDHRSDQLRWTCSLVYDYQMQYYFWEQAKWQRVHGCRYAGYKPVLTWPTTIVTSLQMSTLACTSRHLLER